GARPDGKPLGKTAGKYSVPSFSMKMLRDSADALTTYLALATATTRPRSAANEALPCFDKVFTERILNALRVIPACLSVGCSRRSRGGAGQRRASDRGSARGRLRLSATQ